MAAPNIRLYKYALELVKFYNTIPAFKAAFPRLFNQQRVTYKGYPLKIYVRLIAQIDRQYYEFTRTPLTAENTGELFSKFYLNKVSFKKLEQSIIDNKPLLPLTEHEELARIEQLPDGQTKQKAFDNFLSKKEQEDQQKTSGGGGKISSENQTRQNESSEKKFSESDEHEFIPEVSEVAKPESHQPIESLKEFSGQEGQEQKSRHFQPQLPNRREMRLVKQGAKVAIRALGFGGGGAAAGAGAAGTGVGAAAGGTAVAGVGLGVGWVIVLAIIIVLLIFILGAIFTSLLESNSNLTNNQIDQTITENKVTLLKTGPPSGVVNNGEDIQYDLNVTYRGSIPANIEVTDQIPEHTRFTSASEGGTEESGIVKWTLLNMLPNGSKNLTLIIKPENDIWVSNTAGAKVVSVVNPITGGPTSGGSPTPGGPPGTVAALLPNPLPPVPANWQTIKTSILNLVNANPSNLQVYKEAAVATSVPWEVLAGIHYIEGSNNASQSLVSGRAIGSIEPDVPLNACNKGETGPGIALRIGAGCGFDTLLNSAIYAGNLLKKKVSPDGSPLESFEELVSAVSLYNGGGNRNCYTPGDRDNPRTPYANCPALFTGEDDIYPMSNFDQKHEIMYLVYCSDGGECNPPQVYTKYGVLTIIRALTEP